MSDAEEQEYYNSFGLVPIKDKKKKKEQLVTQLYATPKPDKGPNMPHFQLGAPGMIHQADLLFMPTDKEYKYILVVVDAFSRITDAEPLKSKDTEAVVAAFKKIYSRDILKLPYRMHFDSGSEFKGLTSKWFKDKNISIRVALTGRHRQSAIVEQKNKQIGKALFHPMQSQELLTHEVSNE
jgi:hypothetical protein